MKIIDTRNLESALQQVKNANNSTYHVLFKCFPMNLAYDQIKHYLNEVENISKLHKIASLNKKKLKTIY